MKKKKTTARIVFSLGGVSVGSMMYATVVMLFIAPNDLITGGTIGLVLFVNYSLGIPISLFVSVFNVVMFLLRVWAPSKQFVLTTVLSTIIHPALLRAMGGSGFGGFVLGERLVVVLYAGLLIGGEISIVMRAGASTRDMDIPALMLKEKLDVNVSMTLYIMDYMALGLQLIEADSHVILYGVMLIIVYTTVLNQVLMSRNIRIQVRIASRRYEKINRLIAERTDYGTSLPRMKVGHLHRKQEMILAVISRRDLSRLSNPVADENPEAFIVINQINEVRGRGFALKGVYKETRQ